MKALLARHKVIALDTSIFIYHFEGNPAYLGLTSLVLERIQSGRAEGVASELVLLELLVRPLRLEQQDVADEYELLLTGFPHLTLCPISRQTLLHAAESRARLGFRTPDAIIVATAVARHATLLVTNDRQLKRYSGLTVACLDDFL